MTSTGWLRFVLMVYGPLHIGLILLRFIPSLIIEVRGDLRAIRDALHTKEVSLATDIPVLNFGGGGGGDAPGDNLASVHTTTNPSSPQ